MEKQTWNNPIDKTVDWGGDTSTGGAPVSGEMVQRFIKESFEKKAGEFYYDNTNNRYLVFADEGTRDAYMQDPTQTNLILGTFDAPFNYSAEITLHSKAYNAVFLNSTGNYLDFDFDIKNKQGASTGENVNITYTFIRNATRQTFTEVRKFGDSVRLNIDKYLGEGTNTIAIGVTGQTSLAATTVAITYQVVNLTLEDNMDISKVYDIRNGTQILEIPFTVSGYGTKIVEWYLDGVLLPFVKTEDEVVDVIAERTKYITLSNLQQGTHSLQIRAYAIVNGEVFPTDTLYRDILVYTGVKSEVIVGIATTIPRENGVLKAEDSVAIYDMMQYVPYTLRFATYSPTNAASTEVEVLLDGVSKGVVNSANGAENLFIIISKTDGNKTLRLEAGSIVKDMTAVVKKTDMNIEEIRTNLVLDFNTEGKTNKSEDKDSWSFGAYTGSFSGFNWSGSSGWVNGRLEMNAGATFGIDIAPLDGSPVNNGKTIEIEWLTKNVINDDAVICDLRGDNGVGILITATKVSMTSEDGVVVETEYKSDENVRIGFVINKAVGSTNKRLSFIYANGVLSRAEQWAENDDYTSPKELLFTSTDEAQVSLKAIRIYDTALSSDNMLNNYILYRDSIEDMIEVYDRNDVYEDGTTIFSPEKMMSRLPVMIVTGDIPTLENTSSKDTQIVVDIEYYNTQDPSKSFTIKNAAMRPQGTSSMGYPKKNFRIYTQKVAETILYDAEGKEVADKLYAFKKGSQPVDCWCLKADYAESSGTHNTGIARLWNSALYNAQIGGEYKLRTEAQKIAAQEKYPYDVRTTIDGFPILMFYRKNPTDDLIFIGKYNFNNDKSTESVFGFKGIPNFNNERMQCWEILNNGNALALFTTTENFDTAWKDAFESRYPDTKTPYLGDLKAFSEWMVNVSEEDFATQKWEHFDVYKMAAYWVYLMRHAAADQFVKNAMFTSEDGQHFYFILYDNDTINGLINTGHLRLKPTDGRQTVDATGAYVFAGHDSRLWNMLEADEEFMTIVSEVDNALYSAGISYENTIRIFDEEQAEKWVEKVYNQDAQYKYISPFVEKGVDNLFMLQGRRDLHRRWWLAKRFAIYDAKHVSGSYKSQAVEVKCINGTIAGQQFTIRAGYPLDYGYGINDVPREFGVTLETGEYKQFTTKEVVNLGDPVRIYAAPNIAEIDFSLMADRLAVVNIANIYNEALGTKLTKLVLGNAQKQNVGVSEISGLKQAKNLEHLDIQGMLGLTSINLSEHKYFKTLKAFGSGVSSATFANGAPIERLELPSSLRILVLNQHKSLTQTNLLLEDVSNVASISILSCPHLSSDFGFAYNWFVNKTALNKDCSFTMDEVIWENVDSAQFLELTRLQTEGGKLALKGRVSIPNATMDVIRAIGAVFGDSAFDPNAELYIDVPPVIELVSDTDAVLEGENIQFSYNLYPNFEGSAVYSIVSGREGCTIDSNTGLLTTTETAVETSDIVVKVEYTIEDGGDMASDEKSVQIRRRTYPSQVAIEGNGNLLENNVFNLQLNTEGVNGDYSIEWSLDGEIKQYYSILESNDAHCVLTRNATPDDTIEGTIVVTIRRNFDGEIVKSQVVDVFYEIKWPAGVTILGDENPVINNTYTWISSQNDISGEFTSEWVLSGDILDYLFIDSQSLNDCSLSIIQAPTELVAGTLTLILKKAYNGSVIEVVTKSLNAIIEGVVITAKSNAPVQAALYANGLVANETYSFKEEVEKITTDQMKGWLPSGNKDFTHFEEFRYFTGVNEIPASCFSGCNNLQSIELPDTIASIGERAFYGCLLTTLHLPKNVKNIKLYAFTGNASSLSITVSEENEDFSALDGVLFSKDMKTLISFVKLDTKQYVVPQTVETISERSFYSDSGLQLIESIEFQSNLSMIGQQAFHSCKNLKKITSKATVAPDTKYDCFYNLGTNVTGEKKIFLPLNATGYDKNQWLVLQQQYGFTIHGRLVIKSNKSDARFNVTYTSLSGVVKNINVGIGTMYLNDVQYDTNMTITLSSSGDADWTTKTFVYNDSNQEHTCNFTIGTTVILDQSISDPESMISGSFDIDKQEGDLWKIHNNSHRYLGKYTASGKMTICQLNDSDSTKYQSNGATAILTGEEGDVYMKLPHFWYKAEEIETDKWALSFFYGGVNENPGSGWKEWSGNILIGAYRGYTDGAVVHSISGVYSKYSAGVDALIQRCTNRGAGFYPLRFKHFSMMAFLISCLFGTTDPSANFPDMGSLDAVSGFSNNSGMTYTVHGQGSAIWGLEHWVGVKNEALYNVKRIGSNIQIEGVDYSGGVRGYISKLLIGEDMLAIPTSAGATSTTGFCDEANTSQYQYIGKKGGPDSDARGVFSIGGMENGDSYCGTRITFEGTIIEETNPDVFKSLTAIE